MISQVAGIGIKAFASTAAPIARKAVTSQAPKITQLAQDEVSIGLKTVANDKTVKALEDTLFDLVRRLSGDRGLAVTRFGSSQELIQRFSAGEITGIEFRSQMTNSTKNLVNGFLDDVADKSRSPQVRKLIRE